MKKNTYLGYKFVYDALKLRGFDIPLYGYSRFYLNYNDQRGVNKDGYLIIGVDGHDVLEHRYRAEMVYGGELPKEVIVHHHNANQLIICGNQKYHTLIHKRMRNSGYDERFWSERIKKLNLN